ncbi:MAG: hypothetical protein ACE37M_03795 [Henriciella sp.]
MTDHDPLRDLWASDQGDKFTMSISDLTARSDHFQSRIKRRNLIEYLAAIIVIAAFGWIAAAAPVWSVRIGAILIMAAAVYISWKLHQIGSADTPPHATSAQTLANHHRDELVRQRDALKSVWRWYLLPFVPGMIVFSIGTALESAAASGAPVWLSLAISSVSLGIIAAVFYGIYALNAHAAKKLDAEIDALEAVMET